MVYAVHSLSRHCHPRACHANVMDSAKHQDRRYITRGSWIYLSGLILRLGARVPLLLIAGRLYGASLYGEYILAAAIVETVAATATLGFKRTLFGVLHEA